jgi:hypothetical protein
MAVSPPTYWGGARSGNSAKQNMESDAKGEGRFRDGFSITISAGYSLLRTGFSCSLDVL